MGKLSLVWLLVAKDLRRRSVDALLLVLAITVATGILTLGLVLRGVSDHPYQQTRTATAGPDVVAAFSGQATPFTPHVGPRSTRSQILASVPSLTHARGVVRYSGPYPVAWPVLRSGRITTVVEAEGRDLTPAAVDQPKVTDGTWVRDGGVVIERTFADALGVKVGGWVRVGRQSLRVVGIAVTAASPPYPNICSIGCDVGPGSFSPRNLGLVWVTEAAARRLATPTEPLGYVLDLKLRDPATAPAFARSYEMRPGFAGNMTPWQSIRDADALLIDDQQTVLLVGSWLLGLLAVASMAVLAGGRMAQQARRVGLLKAVGATPGLVAAVFIVENLSLALVAAAAGLVAGRVGAPLVTSVGAGLVGGPSAPSLRASIVGLVMGVATAVAVVATLVPTVRAAYTGTVGALADAPRSPKRRTVIIAASAHLPVSLLIGLRLAARRPRRFVLSVFSITITVITVTTVLAFHTGTAQVFGHSALLNPVVDEDEKMLAVVTVLLLILAGVNAVFITWSTVLDVRHPLAVARALGATPRQVSAGLSAAQLLPALLAAVIGVPVGVEFFAKVNGSGRTFIPPAPEMVAVVAATLVVVALLTAVPARIGVRRPTAEVLQSETA